MFWGKYKTKDRIEYMPQLPIYILRKMTKKKKKKEQESKSVTKAAQGHRTKMS